jgi:hypothetical protein
LQRRSFLICYIPFEFVLTPSEEGTDVDYLKQICTEDTIFLYNTFCQLSHGHVQRD